MTSTDLHDMPARPAGAARILHTSDWHLGTTVRGHSRAEDHAALLDELLTIARAATPDLIVHTGDLFDGHRPPMVEFGRAIRILRDLATVAPVVVLAGNHDSATAMEVLATAVGDECPDEVAAGRYDPYGPCRHRIRIHPRPTMAEHGAVATYPSAAGVDIRLVSVPFVHANRMLKDFAHLDQANATYSDGLRTILGLVTGQALARFDRTRQVAVLATHLHVAGARTSSERAIHISTDYATDPMTFGNDYAYVACGHIHVPQPIGGGRGHYVGSLLEVDFGEEGETKQVLLVDTEPGRPARITPVVLTAGRRLRRIRSPLSVLADQAATLGDALVEVTVLSEPDAAPGPPGPIVVGESAFDSLAAAVAAQLPDATIVSVVDGRRGPVVAADELEPADQPAGSPNEQYREWLVGDGRSSVDAQPGADVRRVAELFDELLDAVLNGAEAEPSEVAALHDLEVS